MRILLIDDSPEFLEVATRYLSAAPEFEVVGRAHTAQEGLLQVLRLQPDLVLMDLAMPDMNGLEATRKIKTLPVPPCVIILTLYDNPEYRQAAEAALADGFIPKSEFASQLLPLIQRLSTLQAPRPVKEKTVKHILIVDDSRTMRRMVHASLQHLKDVTFSEAGSGLEAIEKLALSKVYLMTLDLNMPDMHGIEVLHFVRSHQAYRHIPIIVLTTKGDQVSQTAAMEAGASLYLTKPFMPGFLAARTLEFLEGERSAV
jgi:two-component system chemotaxis response regulator CheY